MSYLNRFASINIPAVCLSHVPSWSCSQAVNKPVWHIPLLCVQWKTPDDVQRNCPKHVEFCSKNKFEKWVQLVGFIIRIFSRCTVTWTSKSIHVGLWENRNTTWAGEGSKFERKFYLPLNRDSDFHRINEFSWKFPLFLFVLHKRDQDGVVLQLLVAFITFGEVSRRNKQEIC